jgi:hypothetical protein
MKHLIRKQVITLQLDAGQNAFLIQQQARDYYYQQIAPALEKLFDELSSENEIVHIEKLEIDLGDLGWKNDRFGLDKESIYRILKQTFGNTISALANSIDSNAVVSYRTPEENTCLQWLYYMEKGVLPWEVQTTDEKWLRQVLHQLATDHLLVEKTRKLIIHDPWFLSRLVGEYHEEFLERLAEVITARRQPDLIDRVKTMANQSSDISAETHFTKKEIWEHVLRQFAAGKIDPDFQEILLSEKKIIPESTDRLDQETIHEGMYCQYAGLVLLHPFFRHLFSHLQLLEDGMFKNTASLEKAVVLLYFIATGKTVAKDYELVVPKIFCGMQLHKVISEEAFLFTEVEREETSNMMHAAIEQWDIIRNTSVEGLRESFLAREGKLLIKDSGIEFRIETRGIDVLLDRLPWNLSLIKFPWLDKLIHVEWR